MNDFRNNIAKSISLYVPGEQPAGNKWIKLNTNENPFKASVAVLRKVFWFLFNIKKFRKYSLLRIPRQDTTLSLTISFWSSNMVGKWQTLRLTLCCRSISSTRKSQDMP